MTIFGNRREWVGGAGGRLIQITAPKDEESWAIGSKHYVTWRSSTGIGAVRIEYSADGGETWDLVVDATGRGSAANVPSSPVAVNRLLWQVPDRPTSRCNVRVSSVGDPAIRDDTRDALSIIASQGVGDYTWQQVTPSAAFAARDGAGALVFKGRMWLLGGWNPRDNVHFPEICNSEVWSSTDGLTWRLENARAPWEGRHCAGYLVYGDRMWIVGGDANRHHYQNDVWSSSDGIHWDLVCAEVPWKNRVLHHSLVHDGKIFVMGGQTIPQFAPAPEAFYNDVWAMVDGANWTRLTAAAPWAPRGMIGGNVVFRNRMWILGGGTYDTPTNPARQFYNDIWSSADGEHWEQHVEFAPWEPRQYHDVAVFDDRMWVMEGFHGSNRNDVHYSSDGVNWYELPDTPWAPRHAASVFVYDDALWLVAGNNMVPDVWKVTRPSGT